MYKVSGRRPLIVWWWTEYVIPADREVAIASDWGKRTHNKLGGGFQNIEPQYLSII